uniref:Ribosyldihydronicotinamide dehydrogenase [quinone] n=1 Tax=Molossus molossus TaxID=27622 RepID=A0A7J8FAK3_MOLMO|nr:N-ribosyldihydronicotinamide:quinone reductase 2 [Molossus molossus]
MAGKKVLIVYAHQEPRSFNGSLKKVAVDELSKQGCTVTVSDLYAMDFEPRATRKDMTSALSNPEFFSYGVEAYEACKKLSLTSDIIDEQKKVQEADLVIFQFPLYWFSVPAILKGWMDRVLCQGFAFDIPGFDDSGFLQGKLALLSITTGGTAEMYSKTGVSGDFRYFLWPLQREGKEERQISIGCLLLTPTGNQACSPGLCPDQESDWDLSVQGTVFHLLSHTSRATSPHFFLHWPTGLLCAISQV